MATQHTDVPARTHEADLGSGFTDAVTLVDEAVAVAREQLSWWTELGFTGRRELLDRWRHTIADGVGELATVVHEEMGKPQGDAVLEITMALEQLAWAARNARRVLRRRRAGSTLLAAHLAGTVEHLPYGVVGVIGPWNYPVYTPMGAIAYALAAGNTVVFKPSELTPRTGQWLVDAFGRAVGRPCLQVVQGRAEVGEALTRSGVDKLSFTGSAATARKVMASCAESLTPVLIEGGGKDVLIVAEDADVPAAAAAAVWGGMSNAGQTCAGVERVLAHEAVYDEVVAEIVREASGLRVGLDEDADLGPVSLVTQVGIIRAQVRDALARGARALVGGEQFAGPVADVPEGAPMDHPGRVIHPTVLVDTPRDATIQREETFGPVLTVDRVESMDEAVAIANSGSYGLGGAVFSRSSGPEIARRIRSGMTSVNNVIGFTGLPALPFGGVGDSGFGRAHGPDGLREFSFTKSVARQRFTPPVSVTHFDRRPRVDGILRAAVGLLHGSRRW